MTEPAGEPIRVADVVLDDIVSIPDVDPHARHWVVAIGDADAGGFRGMRILIFEDKPDTQNWLRLDRKITRWGHRDADEDAPTG